MAAAIATSGGSLETLRKVLQEQADAAKSLSISAATIEKAELAPAPEFDAVLRGRLVLGEEDLAVGFAGTVPAPAETTLTLSGSVSVLGVATTAEVTFELGKGGEVEVRVAIALPDKWTFGESFGALKGQPFKEMALSAAHYVVATAAEDSYEWEGHPYALKQGAWFFAGLKLNGPLGLVVDLLEGASEAEHVVLWGSIDPSDLKSLGEKLPELDLTARLSHNIGIPHFELAEPRLEMTTVMGKVEATDGEEEGEEKEEEEQRFCWLTFATTLSSDGKPFSTFQAALPAKGAKAVTFTYAPLPPHLSQTGGTAAPDEGEINSLLGGEVSFMEAVPPEIKHIFEAVRLESIAATIAIKPLGIKSIAASIGASEPWKTSAFEIDEVKLGVEVLEPLAKSATMLFSFGAVAKLFPEIFTGEFDVAILYQPSPEEELSVSAGFAGVVSLNTLVEKLSGGAIEVPSELQMSFEDFGATYERHSGNYVYTLFGTANASFPLPFLATHAESSLQFITSSATGYQLKGILVLGDSAFQADTKVDEEETVFHGSWTALNEQYLELADLTKYVTSSPPQIPKDLDLALKEANFTYVVTKPLFVLDAESANWGTAVFAGTKAETKWVYFGGVKIDKKIDLTDIPLIGNVLGALNTLAIDEIEAIISSPLSEDAAKEIAEHLRPNDPQPEKGMSGVTLSMDFDVGGQKFPLELHAGGEKEKEEKQELLLAAGVEPPEDSTYWVNVQKTLGPVSFQKVGVRYEEERLWILMNASLSGGGLTIEMFGLGVGSPLTTFEPKFTIEGLGITFAEGPVELSGALFGKLEPLEFTGALRLKIKQLQIGALGAYCEVEDHPSFFLYALLDFPIGGPPFFFVTGISAGFGFNRKLLIPGVDGVASFPFVEWAAGQGNPPATGADVDIGKEVGKVVSELETSGVVAPSVGDYWGAIGVRFTSFEVVDGFALLTIVFGTEFEVDLLGLATVAVPTPEKPVAQAQLALKASFVPATGLLGISGQLTPQSYVLSKEAHLTGGFAFYSWVSGEHAGDFVLTLGGYSPRYTPPEHYPQVPRLGLNWKVTNELTIKGDLYFALTSSAVMAGGGMSAVWQSGDIRAWFEVEADFLLVFQPFHYYLSAGIHLGASFTIDLWFTSITVSIHLGVGLEIWGPEFAGRATIDLSIISFTIEFGGGSPDTQTTIEWDEFVEKLLPSGTSPQTKSELMAAADPPPPLLQLRVADGMVKELSETPGELNWIVNGATLKLETQSSIPIKKWTFGERIELVEEGTKPNTEFGVGPTGTATEDFESKLEVTVTSKEDSVFGAKWVLANVPKALWEPREFDDHGVPKDVDPVKDTTIEDALVGFALAGKVPPADHTLEIPLEYLEYTIDEHVQSFEWSNAPAPTSDPFSDETVWETVEDAGATACRGALVDAIAKEGLPVPAAIEVSELADETTYDLIASPVLSLLGEQK